MKREKKPGSYFFWADWISDAGLQSCSDQAQGRWMNMLCRMFDQSPQGWLPGHPMALAKALGTPTPVQSEMAAYLEPIIDELEQAGVFSRGRDVSPDLPPDAIVSRRMYRDGIESWNRSESAARAARIKHEKQKFSAERPAEGLRKLCGTPAESAADGLRNSLQSGCANDADKPGGTIGTNTTSKKTYEGQNGGQIRGDSADGLRNGLRDGCETSAQVLRDGALEAAEILPFLTDPILTKRSYMQNAECRVVPISQDARGENSETNRDSGLGNLHADSSETDSGEPVDDTVGVYVQDLVLLTGDSSFRLSGHLKRIEKILGSPVGKGKLDELMDRVGKDKNPLKARARGAEPVKKPAALVNAALVKIENEVDAASKGARR